MTESDVDSIGTELLESLAVDLTYWNGDSVSGFNARVGREVVMREDNIFYIVILLALAFSSFKGIL